MVRYLSSSSSDARAIEIVGDSNPQTPCTRRDARCVCSLISVSLLDDILRLVCSGATASPRPTEMLVEHLHPSRLAKQDDIELFCSARAGLKCPSTGGIAPSNTLSFGAKALSTTIDVGSESEVVVPPVVSSCSLRRSARMSHFSQERS